MKTTIILFIVFLLSLNFCQSQTLYFSKPDLSQPKEIPNIVLIWRNWSSDTGAWWPEGGRPAGAEAHWNYNYVGFKNIKDVLIWLNSNRDGIYFSKDIRTHISEDEFVACFWIDHSKEINLKFKEEKKSKPKRIEIQEENWMEENWMEQKWEESK